MCKYYNLIFILFCISVGLQTISARAENYITFNIYHTPPEFLIEGKELKVTITIYEPDNISHAFLSYKNSENENFKIILLKRKGATFYGSIPAEDIIVPWIEYFISAIDIKGEAHTLFHDYRHPYRISVYKKTPEEPAIKSPEEKRVSLSAGYEQNKRESSLDVTRIDSDIIRQLGVFTPAEIVQNFGGMDIRQAKSGYYLLGIRGFAGRNNQVQIRIDGRKLTSMLSRNALLAGTFFSPDDMEKIEILKGPGSYIYGPDAESGIIDITTPAQEREYNFKNNFFAGNLNSIFTYLHSGVKFNSFLSSISTNFIQSDYYEKPELQALSGGTINLKTSYSPSYNIKFALNAGYNKTKMPAFTTNGDYNFYSESSYTQMKFNFNKLYLNAYWNRDNLFRIAPLENKFTESEIFRTNTLPFLFSTDDFRLDSSYSFYTGLRNKVLTGSELRITAYESPDIAQKIPTEKDVGIFILDEIKPFEKLILSFSYRFDWNSVGDPGNSYMGSIAFFLDDNNSIRLSQREGYRKPDFIEYTNSLGTLSNEILTTTQIDYSTIIKGLDFTLSIYYNKFRNFIEYIPQDKAFRNVSENAETFGGEANLDWTITKKLSIFTNYSILRGIDKSKEEDSNHVNPDDTNPNHRINAGIIANNLYNFSGSLTVNYSSKYKDDLFLPGIASDILQEYTVSYVKPFMTVDLKIGYSILKNTIEIGFYGTNILFQKHIESTQIRKSENNGIIFFRSEEIGGKILGFLTGRF